MNVFGWKVQLRGFFSQVRFAIWPSLALLHIEGLGVWSIELMFLGLAIEMYFSKEKQR